MKKQTNNALLRKNECEKLLSGELEKAVWSIIWKYEPVTSNEIARKLGRGQEPVFNVINRLIEFKMVQAQAKGMYVVSRFILDGV